MDTIELKDIVVHHVDQLETQLWDVVMSLYDNPETAFQEHRSAALLAGILQEHAFETERGIGDLETAFRARSGGLRPGPTVAVLAEYDALPGLGHACGHNLIAAAALGAGLAVNAVMPQLPGELQVIGTPAEEGGGGKRILVEAGVFAEVDAAMMFHPARKNMVKRPSLASMRLVVEFFGKPSHAAASPDQGINALEAMILLFNGINAMRQHLQPRARIAGIITHGGEAANIVPAYSRAEFSVRGVSVAQREEVLGRVLACVTAAATATGCRAEHNEIPGYDNILPNPTLARLFTANAARVGRVIVDPDPDEKIGSTDMGNVSQIIPAIHPYLVTAAPEVSGHTVAFREACISPAGRLAMMDAAKSLAMTLVDLLANPALVAQAKEELATSQAAQAANS